MNLHKRLEALEKFLFTESAFLTMPDGRTVTINGRNDYLFGLLAAATTGNVTPEQEEALELIRQSTATRDPGDGLLLELTQALLLSPHDESCEAGEPSKS